MFEITNTPRPYSWGSTTALAELRGVEPSGQPEAELWFGDHAGSPSIRVDDGRTLSEWERDAEQPELPFLLKLLAVASPLSIQVHPTREAAIAGFERENAAGIPLDSPVRNYKDANHKPEIIRAISPFSALSGFRPADERADILAHLVVAEVPGAEELITAAALGLRNVVDKIVRHSEFAVTVAKALPSVSPSTGQPHVDDAIATAQIVAARFPDDPGAVLALFLNHVVLAPGEALAVPAGTVHAYLSGLGVEVMASSDNVLRGGCTSKHIDADEFITVANWADDASHTITPSISGNTRVLRAAFDDCQLVEVDVDGTAEISVDGSAIALVIDGDVALHASTRCELTPGRAVFIEATDRDISASGRGTVVIARAAN